MHPESGLLKERSATFLTAERKRWICLLTGMGAVMAGTAALAYVLLGPFYHESGVATTGQRLPDRSYGLIEEGIEWPPALLLAVLSILLLGVAVGSILDFRSPSPRPALMLRWSALILAVLVGATLVAIGGLFVPAAVLAGVSALAATGESPKSLEASSS
jgi:hypothetical protein